MIGCATIPIPLDSYHKEDYNWYIEYNQYVVEIISEPPGAKIEWDNEYIGEAPVKRVCTGKVGVLVTMIIKAYPISPGQDVQTKILYGNSPIPRKIYFDMRLKKVYPEIPIKVK